MTFLSKFFARRQLRKDVHFVRLPVRVVINKPKAVPKPWYTWHTPHLPALLRRQAD